MTFRFSLFEFLVDFQTATNSITILTFAFLKCSFMSKRVLYFCIYWSNIILQWTTCMKSLMLSLKFIVLIPTVCWCFKRGGRGLRKWKVWRVLVKIFIFAVIFTWDRKEKFCCGRMWRFYPLMGNHETSDTTHDTHEIIYINYI